MADVKISALPAAASAAATDSIPAVQGGVTKKETLQQIADLFGLYPAGTKVYRALLNQAGVAAPVPTILQNSIGAIVWSYLGVGDYRATLAGAFLGPKTMLFINGGSTANFWGGTGVLAVANRTSDNVISVGTSDAALSAADNELVNTPFEIIVFP